MVLVWSPGECSNIDNITSATRSSIPFFVGDKGKDFAEGEGASAENSGFHIPISADVYNCTVLEIPPPPPPGPPPPGPPPDGPPPGPPPPDGSGANALRAGWWLSI